MTPVIPSQVMIRSRRHWRAQLRYFWALASRFRINLAVGFLIFVCAPVLFWLRYRLPDTGQPVSFGLAFHHVYFLIFGQPTLPYVEDSLLEVVTFAVPPLGIGMVVDGAVRFSYLFFAKRRSDKEWITVVSHTMKGHVVICGAGRVGYRVASQLLSLGHELVVVEKREDAAFVQVLRDLNVPVLIDDIRSTTTLSRVNVEKASAIVAATDDDLCNLNVALDARRLNPHVRVVVRLFDDDLVAKVREGFRAEAFSSSALAAPALALAALDPRILHSFQLGGRLMVVSQFTAGPFLATLTVGHLRDDHGAIAIEIRSTSGTEQLHPPGPVRIAEGDQVTVQCEYAAYLKLRQLTGEVSAPTSPQIAA